MVRRLHRLVAFALCVTAVSEAAAQTRPPAEHEVEAAFLYQFGRYVEWPSTRLLDADAFNICVLGADPFGSALDDIVRGKVIADQAVAVKRIVGASESHSCRILFVSPSEENRVPAILKALEGTGIVTVGRGAQFTRRGGMIAFTSENKKVRFIVNLAAADAANVRLSSQLLRVAVSVEK
jgi:YfiR/HmsC-like